MNGTEGYKSLVYAVRFPVLARLGGQLAIVLAVLCLPSMLVAFWYGETRYLYEFVPLVLILMITGRGTRTLPEPLHLLRSEGFVLSCGAFMFPPLLLCLVLTPSGLPLADRIFETISAVTTTGLSTVAKVESMDRTFLFTRAWMQWCGGLGVVVLSITLLMQRSLATYQLLEIPEGQGFVSAIVVYARKVLRAYILLTMLAILVCWWSLGDFFNGLLHGLSAVSTGGFSSSNNSLSNLPFASQLGVMSGGVAGSIALAFCIRIWQGNWRQAIKNQELKFFLSLLIAIGGILGLLAAAEQPGPMAGLQTGVIMGLSALTTTGFANTDVHSLGAVFKLLLILAMFVGGCLGSTAGGFKIFRLQVLLQVLFTAIRKASAAPHAVIEPRLQGRVLTEEQIQMAMLVGSLLIACCTLSWLPFLWYGYDALDSLFEVVSAVGTVGLSSGIVSPNLPLLLKIVLCVDMVAGRVEVLALVCLLYPGLWIGRRNPEL